MTVLIPFAGLTAVPWKNGGGSTTEIAIEPQDAGFDDFDWRISLATIGDDGPFSLFPGVDRTLALVEGHGVALDIDGVERVLVCHDEPVVAFPGEGRVYAKLNRGSTTDFNVMTRRGRCRHQFGSRRLAGQSEFAPRGDVTVLFLAEGDLGRGQRRRAHWHGAFRYHRVRRRCRLDAGNGAGAGLYCGHFV